MSPKPTPIEARFWSKVRKTKTCWVWMAATTSGYGVIGKPGRYAGLMKAHKWAWEQENGPVPEGMELDHLCRNRACVRPSHLEVVTHEENSRRSPMMGRRPGTHCPFGHPYSEENIVWGWYKGRRIRKGCRLCRAARARERYQRRRSEGMSSYEASYLTPNRKTRP